MCVCVFMCLCVCLYGQESPEWISLFKVVTFLLLKISWNLFGKIDWSINSGRRTQGIALDIENNLFSFPKWYQSCNNLQSLDPSLHLSFLNFPNFDTIFCRVLKIKLFFLNIPSSLGKTCNFFVVVENIQKLFFFCKIDLSMNSERQRAGDS